MDTLISSPSSIFSLLLDPVKPILLLGAGASKTSGVPLAGEATEKIIREAYCRDKGLPVNPTARQLLRSDWFPWLEQQPWFDKELSMTDNYPLAVDYLLRPQQVRRDFFLRLITPEGVPPSVGYEALAELLREKALGTILTTNFDNCLYDAAMRNRVIITALKTRADFVQFSYTPNYPQLIYLHGSVEHYSDQNLADEVQRLSAPVVADMKPLLRDHPLVVVGYRGGEPSIMQSLLLDNLTYTNNYRNGIYWCLLKSERPENCPPLVQELAARCGSNFRFVHIDGFDQLLNQELWQRLRQQPHLFGPRPAVPSQDGPAPTFDTQLAPATALAGLEWPLVKERLVEYSKRLALWMPPTVERKHLEEQLVHRNLASYQHTQLQLTAAGALLFTSLPQAHYSQAQVTIRFRGPLDWQRRLTGGSAGEEAGAEDSFTRVMSGNLWRQLNEVMEALALLNRPFRLKGEQSEAVYPYAPLAFKEVIVNALVHRDYARGEGVYIDVEPTAITITSPGGLVEEVRRQVTAASIEDEVIRLGRRGIKGYRNPVLADLFYGAGAMDKAGSGLADVYRWMNENGGGVTFGPTPDNKAFVVTLYSRKELIDEVTQTASPLQVSTARYSANILEVTAMPSQIWSAATPIRWGGDLWKMLGNVWTPPFVLHGGRIWTFYDVSQLRHPLTPILERGTEETLDTEDFMALDQGRLFTQLLNRTLEQHFSSLGLRLDKHHRAYFPRFKEGEARTQSYQARFKKATRTVARPRTSASTGKTLYWEHQALSYQVERYGETWGVLLNPSYVFTLDGWKIPLKSERVNILSTKKAARDYNLAVLNGLVFWSRFLAGGQDNTFFALQPAPRRQPDGTLPSIPGNYPKIELSTQLPSASMHDVSIGFDFSEAEQNAHLLDEVDLELETLATDYENREDELAY